MKKHLLSYALLVLSLVIGSCETTTSPAGEAKRVTVDDIRANPGYAWFDIESNSYTTNVDTVALIKSAFKSDKHKIYIHVNPSCSCEGTQKLFPRFMRVMKDAAISDTSFRIYSMPNASTSHPETSQFTITKLPSIFITRNDSLIATLNNLSTTLTVEQQVLEAIQE